MTQPTAVQSCNLDMENLITDQNRSVATFAITTLLKAIYFYKKAFLKFYLIFYLIIYLIHIIFYN
jgi:hypothetical protein